MGLKQTLQLLGCIGVTGALAADQIVGERRIDRERSAPNSEVDCADVPAFHEITGFKLATEKGKQQMLCNHQLAAARASYNYELTACIAAFLPNGGDVLNVQQAEWDCITNVLPGTEVGMALNFAQRQAAMAR